MGYQESPGIPQPRRLRHQRCPHPISKSAGAAIPTFRSSQARRVPRDLYNAITWNGIELAHPRKHQWRGPWRDRYDRHRRFQPWRL